MVFFYKNKYILSINVTYCLDSTKHKYPVTISRIPQSNLQIAVVSNEYFKWRFRLFSTYNTQIFGEISFTERVQQPAGA